MVLFIFCLITLLSPALTWSLLEELNTEESKGMKIFTCSVVCQVSNCQLFSVAVSKTIYPSMKSEKDLPDDYLSLAERSLVLCQVSYCHLFSVSVNELSTNYHPYLPLPYHDVSNNAKDQTTSQQRKGNLILTQLLSSFPPP